MTKEEIDKALETLDKTVDVITPYCDNYWEIRDGINEIIDMLRRALDDILALQKACVGLSEQIMDNRKHSALCGCSKCCGRVI